MNEYIAFLDSLILSTTQLDKKYRDGVPECVSMIDIQDHSADDANKGTEKPKKRRSNKKMKPGKNGLYPTEDSLIRRWWANYSDEEESGVPGISREETTKNRIAQLRIRETQLQMIVILEVLALQPLSPASEDLGADLPAVLPKNTIADGKEKSAKSKNPDHLATLIDVHIDRLCIWQSIAFEVTKTPSGDLHSASERLDSSSYLPKHADNILKDFCVDVIAPL
jgi:DNA replication regulator SLD3